PLCAAALEAADILQGHNIDCAVINARFVKPLDEALIGEWAGYTGRVVTVEENAVIGGFGEAVLHCVQRMGREDIRVTCLGLPDRFIEHGPQSVMRSRCGLDADGIVRAAMAIVEGQTTPTVWSGSSARL
ncbi:MAG: transketolase C-terminal domain-containing protein, partial [Chloroflexota bacterium]